ncbi:hypothetical protein BCV69DRAFT_294019 [Microstroma glucosiphilum]|uniref:Uncharacterized protein n=1 Tax=Pseudomicrostroma glucosiphilum TaxID=1684307 RepID=A0A316U7E3_9BASI|nr:hypothetical protein BCV69DRAFT_294019 [Pseudomicrostroma glucosiphilum]PWN20273.1 hypothetical protein BCV69DRAFT_294019 [Pseudomicrostroma glucosiphilum]
MSNSHAMVPSTPGQSSITRSSSFRDASSTLASGSKTVRWAQEQQSNAVAPSASTSTQARVATTSSAVSTPVKRAISSVASAVTPVSATVAKSAPPQSSISASPAASPSPRASPASLRTRVKWNAGALVAISVLPRLDVSKKTYWSLLDAVYATLGGRSDQKVDGAAAWLKWALVIVFLVNLLEALALLQFSKPHFDTSATKPIGLTQPPRVGGPVTASAIPPPPPASSARSRGLSEARYSPHSPLKASLEAAGRSVSGNFNSSSPAQSSPLNPSGLPSANVRAGSVAGRRLPSAPPTSGSSPLAAYLARKGTPREQERSVSSDFDGVGDLSSESIEVDRALRALSNSYMRSSSAAAAAAPPQTPVSHAR